MMLNVYIDLSVRGLPDDVLDEDDLLAALERELPAVVFGADRRGLTNHAQPVRRAR